ncbi:uncharacterized protein A1O9_10310 [Exophiala aquamarina CBS 119918]|uniref:Xylanolytic transcriptional activator regulatory domain-containing protein n=1 Tax=Exophiala aquamarina CBS 119918 TaxID=1182545 RepID=A0A072P3Q5_9EURO|nr:uncharacterized protein A1O9_10310 [Exophiala aquamarina CBS 119918]KEF53908.1 hypothetical protein A1O9_10310 [Exophiala aquamarina CBS 119918]
MPHCVQQMSPEKGARHDWECVYPVSDNHRQDHGRRKPTDVEERLMRLEFLVQGQSAASVPPAPPAPPSVTATAPAAPPDDAYLVPLLRSSYNSLPDESRTVPQSLTTDTDQVFQVREGQGSSLNQRQLLPLNDLTTVSDCATLWNDSGRVGQAELDAVTSPALGASLEDHGNASYLSICSSKGVEWISRRTGSGEFVSSAHKFATEVSRTLKLSLPQSSKRVPEPDNAAAERWTTGQFPCYITYHPVFCGVEGFQAFFEDSFEHKLGLVQRQKFETKRQSHQSTALSDPGWYALRNAVYAIGSRLSLATDSHPSSYVVARDTSWAYFENALSVHTELLYMRTNSTAVEALLLMAFYCEAISSPAVEFFLLSSAIRLAQSKGFHLPIVARKATSEDEREDYCWLWWCLYLFDKLLASRACRPSCIHDDDFDLALPVAPRRQTAARMDFFRSAIQHARIASLVSKRLYSTRALAASITELCKTTGELDKQIRQWWNQLPEIYRSRPTSKFFRKNSQMDQRQWTYIYYAFHGTLCAIHNIITYPWVQPALDSAQQLMMATQIEKSSQIVMNASRAIASATQLMEVTAASHVCHINLFLQILQNPRSTLAESDLDLMEVVAGSISLIGYVTNGDLKFSFARELTNIARTALVAARESQSDSLPGLHANGDDQLQEIFPQQPSSFFEVSCPVA